MQFRNSGVSTKSHLWPIVQTRSPDRLIIKAKAYCPNYVERNIRRGTKPRYVSSVGRNLRLDKCDANHRLKRLQLVEVHFSARNVKA